MTRQSRYYSLGVSPGLILGLFILLMANDAQAQITPPHYQGLLFGQDISIKFNGRTQLDYTHADAEISNFDIRNSEWRRLRLGGGGAYGANWKYGFEINIADNGKITITKAIIDRNFSNTPYSLRIGHFKTPNSLDQQTSSRFISTLERAGFDGAFGFDRGLGAALIGKGKSHYFSVGVFGDNINRSTPDIAYSIAGRGVVTPIKVAQHTLHLGVSFRHRELRNNASSLRYRQRPYSHKAGRILATSKFARADDFIGLEAAGLRDHFWIAGEYGWLKADCPSCNNDPTYTGYYLEMGEFFGGRRSYKSGAFSRPKIDHPLTKGGYGALSLVARFDQLDLSEYDRTNSNINGGRLETTILGVDWWPTDHVRVGVNFYQADARLGNNSAGLDPAFSFLINNNLPSEKVRGALLRAQFDF